MIKKIIYSILVVVFLIVITMGMLFIQIKKRNNEIYQSFLNEANQGSYDNFLKLQTKYYQQIDSYSDDYYDVIYYLLITGSNNEKTALIIVKPIKEVKFAEKITDNDDKTKALIYDGEVLVYNSKDDNNYSWKIDTKINRTLADQTIYSTRIVDDVHRVVKKYDNIYELNNERLEKVFSEKQRENLLVFKHDPQTYEILYKAYMQYAHEKYPFKAYYEEHGFLQKYAKNNNGPVIKQLKYLEDKLGSHLDITPKGQLIKK